MDPKIEKKSDTANTNEAVHNESHISTRTASRRTLAKYLNRKCTMIKEKTYENVSTTCDAKEIKSAEVNQDQGNLEVSVPQQNLPVTVFQGLPGFLNDVKFEQPQSFHDKSIDTDQTNKEMPLEVVKNSDSPMHQMLKSLLEEKRPFHEALDHFVCLKPWPEHGLAIGQQLDPLQSDMLSSRLSESIDKQEREIAYNLLLRRLIDENLDREVVYSHQPKQLLALITGLLTRQFPELESMRHPLKIRGYLKACRRNSKKNNGRIVMKNTAAYLNSGPGNRLMNRMYACEHDTIEHIGKEVERLHSPVLPHLRINPRKSPMKPSIPQKIPAKSGTSSTFSLILPNPSPITNSSISNLPLLLPAPTPTASYQPPNEGIHSSMFPNVVFVNNGEDKNSTKEFIQKLRKTSTFLEKIAQQLENSL